MTPFWAGMFENLRGRGRTASLFILVLPTLVILAVIARQIPDETYRNYILPTLPIALLIACAWVVKIFLNERARSRERLNLSSLSCDELNKARAKLVKNQGHRTT